jgi:hypothetical protein
MDPSPEMNNISLTIKIRVDERVNYGSTKTIRAAIQVPQLAAM